MPAESYNDCEVEGCPLKATSKVTDMRRRIPEHRRMCDAHAELAGGAGFTVERFSSSPCKHVRRTDPDHIASHRRKTGRKKKKDGEKNRTDDERLFATSYEWNTRLDAARRETTKVGVRFTDSEWMTLLEALDYDAPGQSVKELCTRTSLHKTTVRALIRV